MHPALKDLMEKRFCFNVTRKKREETGRDF
jgi:hypothetical protein